MDNIYENRKLFEFLKSRIKQDMLEIRDLYVNETSKQILYYPLTYINFDDVLESRRNISELGYYELIAVELIYKKIVDFNPVNPRRKGCFRKSEFLDPSFRELPQTKSKMNNLQKKIEKLKKIIEKESKWSCGGPKPTKEYVNSSVC